MPDQSVPIDPGPEDIDCDRCRWVRVSGLDPGSVIAAIWNAKRAHLIEKNWFDAMTAEQGRAWYDGAEAAGGSFVGFKRLDYVDGVPFKAFINDDWVEALFIEKQHSDDVVAALRETQP